MKNMEIVWLLVYGAILYFVFRYMFVGLYKVHGIRFVVLMLGVVLFMIGLFTYMYLSIIGMIVGIVGIVLMIVEEVKTPGYNIKEKKKVVKQNKYYNDYGSIDFH